jgi:hypothetical protein
MNSMKHLHSLLSCALAALLAGACAKAPADAAVAAPARDAPPAAAPTTVSTPAAPVTVANNDATVPADATAAGATMATAVANVAGDLQATLGEGVGKAVSLSTNAQAHEYAGVLAAVTGEMLQSNPDACARLLLPAQFGPIGWNDFPAGQRERFMALQQAIFATARNTPTPAPGEDEAGPLYDAMAEKIYAAQGEQALDGLQGDAGAAAACRAWNRIYTGLAAESVDDGGRVVRWLNAP